MASLNPLTSKLGFRKAKHLLRRATFNYSKSQLDAIADMTATDAVNSLATLPPNILAEPYDPLPTSNPDGFWTSSTNHPNTFTGQTRKRALVTAWWWYNAINQVTLKHKLSFFIHTSFTVGKDSGAGLSTNFYDHIQLLDLYAYGNLKTLAKKITLDNSMLDYLDNTNNVATNPNENYAREFLELFTILKGPQIGNGNYTNYTEIDVQQAAKVFSGFKQQLSRAIIDTETNLPSGYANKNQHSTSNKTFSAAFNNQVIIGKNTETGMFEELHDFVEMVFAQPETAKAYCRKLYKFYVKSEWNETVENDIITPLSQILITNNYDILPVVKALLASEHFYDADDGNPSDNIIGSIVKSPMQLLNEVSTLFNLELPNPNTNAAQYYANFFFYFVHNVYLKGASMDFFNPDSVAGYPAHYQEPDFDRLWFSSNTLISRYKLIESLILGKNTITSGNIFVKLDTVLFVKNNILNPSNPNDLVTEIANLLYPESIDTDRTNYFKGFLVDAGFPDYYWTGAWSDYISTNDNTTVKVRLDALITAMINAAEFQLM
ncbi:DUF1800 domain-containing protein [Siansivirga zeaxanthinifaciens]|uniref:DUF1800 domain-containing protein n=1 Tax=Siansivirga zeaxanthinifaciens CC-SAMT-1 TaxID=1454006 RepID=A0A0C5WCW3_9FLAO|nr:DUF1800 family protein [Siansivirga zeaxanthinifaciens]AJR04888.1 hypothetical protein AW14_08515 [Siansivirga zeaxanthinifaciens CC-SAMT-1]